MGHKSKRIKKSSGDVQIQITDFKSSFKHFKRKDPAPDLNNVVDVQIVKFKHYFEEVVPKQSDNKIENANDVTQWKINQLLSHPGITIIQNVFSDSHLNYWASRCIKDFSGKSNKRNIDHPDLNLNIVNWYEEASREPGVVDKLRWTTLGYHHDWDTKIYSEEKRGDFPPDLAALSASIVSALRGDIQYNAEAAIVNYYPVHSSLSGHTDHSELNLAAPLVSISLGLPAIFLIGGPSLHTVPTPLLLRWSERIMRMTHDTCTSRSGDVLVMESQARLCYHAVPRILGPGESGDLSGHTDEGEGKREKHARTFSQNTQFVEAYLSCHRININIRQVH